MAKNWLQDSVGFSSIIILLVYLTYSNSLEGSFVWDDRAAIIDNEDVQGATSIWSLLTHDFWGTDIRSKNSHKSYRPLTALSFRIDHNLYGFTAYGYHLTSLLIYCLTCIAMYYVCRQWLIPNSAKVASLLFIVHPVHVEAVSSLVGRADNLCGLFFLLSTMLYTLSARATTQTEVWFYFFLSMFSGVLSSLSKEVGLTVFAVLVVIELLEAVKITVVANKNFKLIKKELSDGLLVSGYLANRSFLISLGILKDAAWLVFKDWDRAARVVVSMCAIVIFLLFRSWLHGRHAIFSWTVLENHVHTLPSLQTRILSYAQTHVWYAVKLFYPKYLCFDYGYSCLPTIESLVDTRNILPFTLYSVCVFVICSALVNMQVTRMLAFVCLFFPLLPALNILIPVGTLLAERLLFVPSIGFCMLASEILVEDFALLWQYIRNAFQSVLPIEATKTPLHIGKVLLAPLLYLCVMRSRSRNVDWGSEQRIYRTALIVCPTSIKALANYAVYAANDGDYSIAQDSALLALQLYPKHAVASGNAGLASSKLGDFVRAVALLEYSFFIDSRYSKVPAYLSETFYAWSRSLDLQSPFGLSMSRLSMEMLTNQDNFSIQTPASLAAAALNAFEMSDFQQSIKLYKAAIAKSSVARTKRGASRDVPVEDDIKLCFAYNKLAEAYNAFGDRENAVASMEEGHQSDSLCEPIVVNLAALYKELGQSKKAKEKLSSSVKTLESSCSAVLLNNYGNILLDLGESAEALLFFEKALSRIGQLHSSDVIKQGGKINIDASEALHIIQGNIAKANTALGR